MKEEQQQRQQVVKEQHLKSLARGHAAAQADRLRARAQQTEAQLSAADQAQRAKRAQALNPMQPAQLGMRYEGTHITSAFAPNALAPSACGKWQKLMHSANKLSLCTSEVTTEVAMLTWNQCEFHSSAQYYASRSRTASLISSSASIPHAIICAHNDWLRD